MACLTADQIDGLRAGGTASAEHVRHLSECALCATALGDSASSLLGATLAPATPRSEPSHRFAPGARLDRYQLLDRLGAGGMGEVWAAYDPKLDRRVALKVMRPDAGQKNTEVLTREARAMAQLAHPNVVAVFDVGEFDGELFVAMEAIDGGTLHDWLRTAREPSEIVAQFIATGRGLAAAHQAGIIHRDFKPANVLIGRDGRPRVTDFGLATLAPRTGRSITSPGLVMGTLGFMSPEQVRGEAVDARTDQFAFCAALWQALFAQLPFPTTSFEVYAWAVREGKPTPPPADRAAPPHVEAALRKGLSARAEDRFPSMDALLDLLADNPRRRKRLALGAAALMTLLLAAGVFGARALHRAQTRCQTAAQEAIRGWSPEHRERLGRRFREAGFEALWPTVAATLDRFSQGWSSDYAQTCEATAQATHGAEAGEKLQCLDTRLESFRSVLALLDGAAPPLLRRAPDFAAVLDGSRECDAPAGSASASREVPSALRPELAQLNVLYQAGLYSQGIALANKLEPAARRSGSPRAQAEVAVRLAWMEAWEDADYAGHAKERTQRLQEAARLAERAKADDLRAEALIGRLSLYSEMLPRETLQEWSADAEAAVERAGNGAQLRSLYATYGSAAFNRVGDSLAAEQLVQAHLPAVERAFGPRSGQVADLLVQLASALDGLKRHDEAYATVERAMSIFTEKGIAPEQAEELKSFALIAAADGHFDRGLALMRQSIAGRLRSPEPLDRAPLRIGVARDWEGLMLERLGRCEEADAAYQQARAELEPLLTADGAELAQVTEADALIGSAHCTLMRGRAAEASQLLRRAIQLGVGDDQRHEPHYFLAEALWQLGRRDEARKEIARARESFSADASDERVSAGDIERWDRR